MKDYKNQDAIVLFSGGQDSTTCLFWAKREFRNVLALCFTYGQRHLQEVENARRLAKMADVEFVHLDTSVISQLAPNSLTDKDLSMDKEKPEKSYPNTFVPGRNLLFLTFAATIAYARDIRHIVTGVSEADYSGYPDCRDTFIKSANASIRVSTGGTLKARSPYATNVTAFTKVSMIRLSDGTEDRVIMASEMASDNQITVDGVMVIDLTAIGLDTLTLAQCDARFSFINDTKSTIGAGRLQSTDDKGNVIGELYYIAKDKDGNIIWLRSVPSANDEIDATRGKLIKRVSDWITLDGNEDWFVGSSGGGWKTDGETVPFYLYDYRIGTTNKQRNGSVYSPDFSCYKAGEAGLITGVDREGFSIGNSNYVAIRIAKSKLTGYSDELSSNEKIALFKQWLSQNPIRLIYQLAEPVEIPVQVSGSIVSYPNGTVYIERILPDAGVYTDKITILHQDAPIKRLDRLSKVDFYTGVETELDVIEAVIAEDKLSFTHPELNAGDIVFFEYEYDVESTDKFYKWNVTVADGVPSIELVEV